MLLVNLIINTKFDTFLAGFPAGTVSGAPKIRAMEIIDEFRKREKFMLVELDIFLQMEILILVLHYELQ